MPVTAPARPLAPPVELLWPTRAQVLSEDRVRAEVHRVTRVVSGSGYAGWLTEVDRAGSDAWLSDVLESGARLVLARLVGRVEALGRWERYETRAHQRHGRLRQVMTHPDARRRGLARSVVQALVDDARAAGMETLTLDVRSDNHAAIALYTSLGFHEYGWPPRFIAGDGDRFDRGLIAMRLNVGSEVNEQPDRLEKVIRSRCHLLHL